MENLSTVIEDSITDATLPTPEVSLDSPEPSLDPSPEPSDPSPSDPVEPATDPVDPVKTGSVQDDFDRKFGLAPTTPGGRDNRIPYSRVKKITEKALSDAKTSWEKDFQAKHVPVAKFQELDTKVKDYEARLTQVAEFEKVMTQNPAQFLQMLNGLPAYAKIFDELQRPAAAAQQQAAQPQAQVPTEPVPTDRPMPDQELSDGSMVYSLEGLDKLLAWQDNRTTNRVVEQVMKQVESRYGSIEKDYNSYQTVQKIMPQVQSQIADARTWPLFNESEAEIVQVLKDYPKVSLERAYQHVVLPKLQQQQQQLAQTAKVSREQIRAEVLNELKNAPRSTAVTTGTTRPNPPSTQSSGAKRSIESVIAESIKALR